MARPPFDLCPKVFLRQLEQQYFSQFKAVAVK